MIEEDAERLFGTEVDKVQSKPCFLVMTRPTALRNSQQPWVPAQTRAGQHSSVDLGRSSQLLHKSLFIFSPSLPSHTWVYRICSSFSKDWLFHVTQFFYWVASISFCIPSVQELWMAYFLSLHVRFLHLYHISWQLLMPQICLTLWTGRFLILCYYFSGYPRRKGKYMIMWE